MILIKNFEIIFEISKNTFIFITFKIAAKRLLNSLKNVVNLNILRIFFELTALN